MLAGGKEVKHLIIGGETFSKSNYGKKVKLLKDVIIGDGYVTTGGVYNKYNRGGTMILAGTPGYIIVFTYGNCYFICNALAANEIGTWVKKDMVEIEKNGGVNSLSYLLIIYNMEEAISSC